MNFLSLSLSKAAASLIAIALFLAGIALIQNQRPYATGAALAASIAASLLAGRQLLENNSVTTLKDNVAAAILMGTVIFLSFGLSVIVLFTDRWPTGILWAGAYLVGAGFLGMLFGVPLRADSSDNGQTNTLLAQSADTLSKFITGFTAAKYQTVFKQYQDAAAYLADCLRCCEVESTTKLQYNSSFAGGIIAYFSLLGFVSGILLARFYDLNGSGRPDTDPKPVDNQGKDKAVATETADARTQEQEGNSPQSS